MPERPYSLSADARREKKAWAAEFNTSKDTPTVKADAPGKDNSNAPVEPSRPKPPNP